MNRLSMLGSASALLFVLAGTARADDFQAPDSGDGRTNYACTFHWFRTDPTPTESSHIVGMDVIRNEVPNAPEYGLRVFVTNDDGSLRWIIVEQPTSAWYPFVTGDKPDPTALPQPFIGRGLNWIAGSVSAPGQSVGSVTFSLDLAPTSNGQGPEATCPGFASLVGQIGGGALNATDWTSVNTSGTITIDGTTYTVSQSAGPASIHYGDHLVDYAYLTTVPDPNAPSTQSLVAAVRGDDFGLLGSNAFTYGYGGVQNGAFFGIDSYSRDGSVSISDIDLGFVSFSTRIELSNVQPVAHHLVGVRTVTATATARVVHDYGWFGSDSTDLGQVVIDLRGEYLAKALPADVHGACEQAWASQEGTSNNGGGGGGGDPVDPSPPVLLLQNAAGSQ